MVETAAWSGGGDAGLFSSADAGCITTINKHAARTEGLSAFRVASCMLSSRGDNHLPVSNKGIFFEAGVDVVPWPCPKPLLFSTLTIRALARCSRASIG